MPKCEWWYYQQEGLRETKVIQEVSLKDWDQGQAADTEWDLTKSWETTTISVKDLLGRKGPVTVGMLGAQSVNKAQRYFPMELGPTWILPWAF